MRSITRASWRALAGIGTLALSIATVARGQQAPDPTPLTEVQAAGIKRVKEMIEALNSGNFATIRAYFDTQADPNGFENALGRYHLSRGYDLLRVELVPSRGDLVAGIVRNRITGDEDYLAARIEQQAPYRITLFQARVPDDVAASWKLKPVNSTAVTEKDRLQEISTYLKRLGDADIFSGAIVFARDGKPVFAQGYGFADREKKIPNTVETAFFSASVIKLFTGLAIGQLVEQGKLSYEDPLSKFLPDFPDPESARKIRIKHLLSHTAGLGNYLATPAYRAARDRLLTIKDRIDIFERTPPAFEPGTKWAYSNNGFELLGRVIEIVSGQDYYDYMQKHVFAPAGTTSASFPLQPAMGVAAVPMAYPYEFTTVKGAPDFQNKLGENTRRGSAAGNALVSALDLLKLANAIRDGRIVKPETFRLHSSAKPELGSPNYGYGFIAGPWFGRPFVGHNGRAPGECNEFGELRDTPYTIVVLSNVDFICASVTSRILRVLRPS